jgi:hypothetical protein
MALVYDEPQIDYERHGIDHDTYEQFGYGDHICVKCPISKEREFNQSMSVEQQCHEVNKRTDLNLQPDGVSRIYAHDRVVDVWFDMSDSEEQLTSDSETLSSGVVEMNKPTIIKKQGSQWVGCNMDFEVLTDTYSRKNKGLMKEYDIESSTCIGKDEEGKIYMAIYDADTLKGAKESLQ